MLRHERSKGPRDGHQDEVRCSEAVGLCGLLGGCTCEARPHAPIEGAGPRVAGFNQEELSVVVPHRDGQPRVQACCLAKQRTAPSFSAWNRNRGAQSAHSDAQLASHGR